MGANEFKKRVEQSNAEYTEKILAIVGNRLGEYGLRLGEFLNYIDEEMAVDTSPSGLADVEHWRDTEVAVRSGKHLYVTSLLNVVLLNAMVVPKIKSLTEKREAILAKYGKKVQELPMEPLSIDRLNISEE